MSGYCDAADVQALVPARRFAATTTPSIEDVQRYITGRSAELDALMSERGIEVPVEASATVSRGWLRLVTAYGAAADAEAAGPNTTAASEGEHLAYLRGRWDTMTGLLLAGAVSLPDATRVPVGATDAPQPAVWSAVGTAWFTRDDIDGGRLDGTPPTPVRMGVR